MLSGMVASGEAKVWSVYVLECKASSGRITLHVGISKKPWVRLLDHQNGRVKATRGKRVTMLGFSRPKPHGDALRMESQMKKMPPDAKRWKGEQWSRLYSQTQAPQT